MYEWVSEWVCVCVCVCVCVWSERMKAVWVFLEEGGGLTGAVECVWGEGGRVGVSMCLAYNIGIVLTVTNDLSCWKTIAIILMFVYASASILFSMHAINACCTHTGVQDASTTTVPLDLLLRSKRTFVSTRAQSTGQLEEMRFQGRFERCVWWSNFANGAA